MAAVGNLVDTIAHNLKTETGSGESFYQRGCWTNRLKQADAQRLRALVRKFLEDTDEAARNLIRPFEQETAMPNQMTAGISLFYFEER